MGQGFSVSGMCSYCGCDSESLVAELMSEHEEIAGLARQAAGAAANGDSQGATALCGQIARLFDAHGRREEEGLFAELRSEQLALDGLDRLEVDHRRLRERLGLLAGGDLADLGPVLADLLDHAGREDSDLFPYALVLLSNSAWVRISRIQREGGRDAA